jgi:hypothetical protein
LQIVLSALLQIAQDALWDITWKTILVLHAKNIPKNAKNVVIATAPRKQLKKLINLGLHRH